MSRSSLTHLWVHRARRRPPRGAASPIGVIDRGLPVRLAGGRSAGHGGRRTLAALTAVLLPLGITAVTPGVAAAQAPVGQGFSVTPSDLSYILRQIKIAEKHVADTTSETGPCGALLSQLGSPVLSFGLRTVDGSCNNLQPGQEKFGASGTVFPRLATPSFQDADTATFDPDGPGPAAAGAPTSYKQKSGAVFDSDPRMISNLIVDQTATNPAAVEVAGSPARTQGSQGVKPCTAPDTPAGCIPAGQTLPIPNVTTDVGLSPPFNGLFTIFGQFFDHGVDLTQKGGSGTVFMPLPADDPLIIGPDGVANTADDPQPGSPRFVPANQRFMVLTRATNQPGPDGVLGSADDVQEATNQDSSWVDQSQTYTSNPSHQVFLREYVKNTDGRPAPTGGLLTGPKAPGTDGGMATWKRLKDQAATLLGLRLVDSDALNIPMLAVDPYGRFIPGPARGLPQYVTPGALVEGDAANPVPVPADGLRVGDAFLLDIANNANPKGKAPDTDPDINSPAPRPAGTYDNEMLDAHFVAGDGRVNENIALTAVHQVFHSEHNRLTDDIKNTLTTDTSPAGQAALAEWKSAAGADGWNGERLFQAARFVTEMEYQHLVFEEFARKIQPAIDPFQPFAFTQTDLNASTRKEFADAVYRFGHSMLTEDIDRINENGSRSDIPLLDGFLNPPAYTQATPGGPAGVLTAEQAAGGIIMGMSDQVGDEIDEFVTDTLRNNLLGLPLDLPTLNLTRARDAGTPSLNNLRKQIFGRTNDGQLKPYTNWIDFGENLKNPVSLVNFVAAYGQHPTITSKTTAKDKREAAQLIVNPPTGATNVPVDAPDFMGSVGPWANNADGSSRTGLDGIDLWVGGLAERTNLFGGLLGSTFNYVFENQMADLQNGDRLYYLARTTGMNLRTQLEGNSFAEMIMRNTSAHSLKADPFATADCKFQLSQLNGTAAGYATQGQNVTDDPATECNENALLLRMPDGTIRYKQRNSVDPAGINGQSVFNGTPGVDRVWGGVDNDTFRGNETNDIIEGGDGADQALGGDGNDIITDSAGDDVLKGGPGNDALDGGIGLDLLLGGAGKDLINGGANSNDYFAGEGDDFVVGGSGVDRVIGDSGDDWQEGGDQPDLLIGDSSSLFFTDPNAPGNDILIGQGGDDDHDGEGGNDVFVAGPGVEKNAGAAGYDFSTGKGDPQVQDADLALPIPPVAIPVNEVRDRWNEVEALSGWDLNDTLRGDDVVPTTVGGAGFIGCDVLDQAGLDAVAGLDDLVPPLSVDSGPIIAASASLNCPITGNVWGDGNILLGGGGDDLIEGRGANDIIDGDRWLNVRLSVRTNPTDPATEIGSADLMTSTYLPGNPTTLQQAVFAGTVDPGNIVAVREILTGTTGPGGDTALFSGALGEYDITTAGGVVTVNHARPGAANNGIDTLRNVEKLRFADQTVTLLTPAAPTGVSATAGNGGATVTWAAPPANGGTGITGYEIVVNNGTTQTTVTGIPSTARSHTVTGLANGTAYTFQVRAINQFGAGALSAPSNPVTPQAPAGPTITAQIPAPGATNVAPNTNVSATFNVPMVASGFRGSGNASPTVVLRNTVTGAVVGSALNYNATTRTVSLNPNADLAENTQYTMALTGDTTGNIRAVTGNVPLATTSWSFTTANLPPTNTARTPANGAASVAPGVSPTATFSEVVVGVSVGNASRNVVLTRVSDGSRIPAVVSINAANRIVTVNPVANLAPLTQYRVTLTGGPSDIRDQQGTPLATTSWTFTTR
jgi:Ca2+-binding RTX toxin-like protein